MKLKNYLIAFTLFSFTYAIAQKPIPINNNSFKSDLAGWDTVVWGNDFDQPKAFFDISNNGQDDTKALKVSVRKNSKDKKGDQIFVKQNGFRLKKGKKYTISFWVKSRAFDDDIMVRIFSAPDTGSDKPWAAVLDKVFEYDGNGSWQKITHTFTAEAIYDTDPDFKNLAILLGFDRRMGTYLVDNVRLERL